MTDLFQNYDGDYEKEHYDVLLDETVYLQIWPNAGIWRTCDGVICSDDNRTAIKIRKTIENPALCTLPQKLSIEKYKDFLKALEMLEDFTEKIRKERLEKESEKLIQEQNKLERRQARNKRKKLKRNKME